MAQKRKPRPKKKPAKKFRFELGWSGLGGVIIVTFCLFLWMFMLGVWAGQTLLLPPSGKQKFRITQEKGTGEIFSLQREPGLPVVQPKGKKEPVSPAN